MWRSKRCYIALLLFSTIFLGLFVRSSDASAVSYTLTLTSGVDSSNPIDVCNSFDCSTLQYIEFDWDYPSETTCQLLFTVNSSSTSSSSNLWFLPQLFDHMVYSSYNWRSISSIIYSRSSFCSDYFSAGASATLTFSDTIPSFSSPSGTLSITENGTFNVSSYEYAEVDVPASPVTTPYDGKLDSLIQAVYVVAGTMLVIYFFYALYRIYMGGKT